MRTLRAPIISSLVGERDESSFYLEKQIFAEALSGPRRGKDSWVSPLARRPPTSRSLAGMTPAPSSRAPAPGWRWSQGC